MSLIKKINNKNIDESQLSFHQTFEKGHIQPEKKIKNTIIGVSPKFVSALELAKKCSASLTNIYIGGESGAGKEVFAKYIHEISPRRNGPFVAINCSAIPDGLLESELFGHAKGSFTGAFEKKVGLFEEAENGTLFLDEIGDLCLSLQAKLLRVLQERKIKRVGENQYRSINCRIISASHKNILAEVDAKRFREDLYFRLNVIPIHIPPLRERPEDLMLLSEFFLSKFSKQNDCSLKVFTAEARNYLQTNKWRGNVRELENAIERAVVLSAGHSITSEDFAAMTKHEFKKSIYPTSDHAFTISCSGGLPSLDDVIHRYVTFAVKENDGARDKTAKDIGIDRKTLYRRLETV